MKYFVLALLATFASICVAKDPYLTPKEWAGNIVVEDFKWELGGFDTVLVLKSIRLKNQANLSLKDVRVECQTYGASGTRLSKARQTVYETLPPRKTRTLRDINVGFVNSQSKRAECHVTRAEPA